jgi:hypothetical protein
MSRHVSKFAVVLALVASTFQTLAAAPSAIPPNILATDNKPMVMLSASKDFTMFWKAYTDFDDIDFDGVVDRTFMANSATTATSTRSSATPTAAPTAASSPVAWPTSRTGRRSTASSG